MVRTRSRGPGFNRSFAISIREILLEGSSGCTHGENTGNAKAIAVRQLLRAAHFRIERYIVNPGGKLVEFDLQCACRLV